MQTDQTRGNRPDGGAPPPAALISVAQQSVQIMTPEDLDVMTKGILDLLLMVMQSIALTIGLVAMAGFAIYLIGIAKLCLSETRQESATPIN
jgi:hypothetical protein